MLAERGEGNDFLGGAVVKNPPANAGDTGSIPDLGSPRAVEQINPCTTTAAQVPRARASQ